MADKPKSKRVITPEATAMFVYVWEPRESINEGGSPQYSISLLFKKNQDLTALRNAAKEARIAAFGPKRNSSLKDPFRSADEMETPVPGYKGGTMITAKSKNKPGIVDADLSPITDALDFYPGCICKVSVTPYAFDKKGSKGVTFLLNNIQKVRDGTRLDGRKKAEEEFDAIGDEEDDPLS